MTTRRPRIEDYVTPDYPSIVQTKIMLGREGLFFNNRRLSLTSLFSYIVKINNRTVVNISHPNLGMDETKATTLIMIYRLGDGLPTLWLHLLITSVYIFLFTYQKPTNKKFETNVVFSDETTKTINATGNNVTEIRKILIEIDSSYTIAEKVKIWTSFHYSARPMPT